jgi:GT2 family glycosyltransferase
LKFEALRFQRANQLDLAERLYQQVLAEVPQDADCLHMLGVVCLQTARPLEAVRWIFEAGELTDWEVPEIRHNLGLALHHALLGGDRYTLPRRLAYQMWRRHRAGTKRVCQPLVSVVVPSYCHATYIVDCLRSVFEHTYRSIELIVIDDGSTDGSPAIIEAALRDCPFPHRFVARENRGAHVTINEGIALATGEYINVLNSDDRFSPDRILCMVEAVCRTGSQWGVSNVEIIDAEGQVVLDPPPGTRAAALKQVLFEGPRSTTLGFGFLKSNFAITTGNLFVCRELFMRVGGFSDLRYNHDWEFALKASLESEPVYVPQPLYFYRLHDHNTIAESNVDPRREAQALFSASFQHNRGSAPNPFAPCEAGWGSRYLAEQARWALDPGLLRQQALSLMGGENTPKLPSISSLEFLTDRPQVGKLLDHIAANGFVEAIPFDQAQRYGVTARAIEALRQPGQTFRILEVGANQHRRLDALLPRDQIVYLDLEVSGEMKAHGDMVEGDATALTFPDGCFDVVVALDVLEHIPASKRQDFLWHTTRVAGLMTIIAAPFDNPQVRAAEAGASLFWDELMPVPYRWLAEHSELGLPDLRETQALLTQLGLHHWSIGHGHLDLWRDMLKGHFAAEAMPELKPAIRALDDWYAKQMLTQDFSEDGVYRSFLFCSRDASLGADFERHFRSWIRPSAVSGPVGTEGVQAVLREIHNLAITCKPVDSRTSP